MIIDWGIIGYYVYFLVVVGIFFLNCRNWAYIRTTLLYFFAITVFACLIVYGSAYSLDGNFLQLQQKGWLGAFPVILQDGPPDVNTIAKSSAIFWYWLIPVIIVFVTFPQAVLRGASIFLDERYRPEKITHKIGKFYNWFWNTSPLVRKWLPRLLGTGTNLYVIGEWIFLLIMLSSLLSLGLIPIQNWPLMLICCCFFVLITLSAMASGKGLLADVLRSLLPMAGAKILRFINTLLQWVIYLICLLLSFLVGSIIYSLALLIFHTQSLNIVAFIVVFLLVAGFLTLSILFLSKLMLYPLAKLAEWMDFKAENPL